jgi:hypothetical protein
MALLPLLLAPALAGGLSIEGPAALAQQRLGLDEVGFVPAAEDRPALGPELYAVSADGAAGLYDPGRREVLVLGAGGERLTVAVPRLDDLAFAADGGLLLLDEAARTLTLTDAAGETLDVLTVPGLVPPGSRLRIEGDEVRAVDLFGNRHRLATLDGEGLADGEGPALLEDPWPVRWDAAARVMRCEGLELALPEALKASGQVLLDPGGEPAWLLVDQVVAEGPLVVERTAWRIDGEVYGEVVVRVPVGEGAWTPGRAAAAGPGGSLTLLLPGEADLDLARVSP